MQIAALSIIDEVIDTATFYLETTGDPITHENLSIMLDAWGQTFLGRTDQSSLDHKAAIDLALMRINQCPIHNRN